jgi:L-fuculose-phosphate aldolase
MKPSPFAFSTEIEARERVIEVCLQMQSSGLNPGKSGNVSVRFDRSAAAGVLITPSAVPYEQLEPMDIVWLPVDAEHRASLLREDPPEFAPSSEWPMHLALYTHRDAQAVVHTHSQDATALSCCSAIQAGSIPPFHYMTAAAGGSHIPCARYATFGSEQLSQHMLVAIEGHKACLLAHHGVMAFSLRKGGEGLQQALALAHEVEHLAGTYLKSMAAGGPEILDAGEMHRVSQQFAKRSYGGFQR